MVEDVVEFELPQGDLYHCWRLDTAHKVHRYGHPQCAREGDIDSLLPSLSLGTIVKINGNFDDVAL